MKNSKESSFSDRKCYRLDSDLFRMNQLIEMSGQETGYDATGNYWIIGYIKILSGQLWFLRDGEKVVPSTNDFIMVMPPNSVVSADSANPEHILIEPRISYRLV